MKKVCLILVSFSSIIGLSSCASDIVPKKEIAQKEYKIENVDELLVKDICLKQGLNIIRPNLYLLDGDESKIIIKTNNDLQSRINVRKSGDCLQIVGNKLENYVTDTFDIYIYNYTFEEITLSSIKASASSSSLSKSDVDINLSGASYLEVQDYECDDLDIDLSGASYFEVDNVKCNTFDASISGASKLEIDDVSSLTKTDIDVSGASNLDIDTLTTLNIDVDVSGASVCELSGTGVKMLANISGASKLEALDLLIQEGNINCSGASYAETTFSVLLKADASGASTICYNGDANNVQMNVSGGSKIIKK